jgi:aminopeptidase N
MMRPLAHRCLALGLALAVVGSAASILPAAAEPPHHDIVLALDPATASIKVRDRIQISGHNAIALRLAPWMRMIDIRLDGQSAPARRSEGLITLALPSAGAHQIDVVAEGAIPRDGASGERADSASTALASRDGVYLPGWVNWFPQADDDTLTFSLTIETPPDVRATATGKLESEELNATRNTVRFSTIGAPEPPSVFAGPYTVAEMASAGVNIRTYFHKPVERLAQDYMATAARYIQLFEEQIGTYPFPDFHIVSAPLPVGLGFPGLTYIDRRILPLPFIKDRSLAHEVLHNWWGNGVFADIASGNWTEGLTTYMADHDLAAGRDRALGEEMRLGWLRDYAALPAERDVPVTRFRSKVHDAAQVIGYGKVALIFHMLRDDIGDAAFKNALRQFWTANRFRTASWSDLRRAFEASARTDLGWFFEQWTERAGAPRLELLDASVTGQGGAFELALTLGQSAPTFRLKVPVEIATAAGAVHSHVVLDEEKTTARITLNAAPLSVRIDPEHTLFRRLLPGEAPPILRDVLLDGQARTLLLHDEPGHLTAARQLAEGLFDAATSLRLAEPDQSPQSALLAIGPARRIDDLMQRLGVEARPTEVAHKGSARAWMATVADNRAVLFIEAERVDDLEALLRSMPHYRSKSFLVLEGGRVVTSGVLAPTRGPLAKRLP